MLNLRTSPNQPSRLELATDDEKRWADNARRVKQALYSSSIYHMGYECLGVDVTKTPHIVDPRVKENVHKLNIIFQTWIRTRMKARARGEYSTKTFTKVLNIQPRGTYKTFFGSLCLPIVAHIHDPNISMALSSYKDEVAEEKFGQPIRDAWEGLDERSQLVPLFGHFRAAGLKWNKDETVTAARTALRADPTLRLFSVLTGGTSGHPDLVVLDDPTTQELLARHGDGWNWKVFEHYKSLGMLLNQDGMLLINCTRYDTFDIVGIIIQREIEPVIREMDLPEAPVGELPHDFDYDTGWIKYAHHAGWHVIYDCAWEGDIWSEDPEDYVINFEMVWPRDRILAELRKDEQFAWAQLNNQPGKRSDAPVLPIHIEQAWCTRDMVPPGAYQDLVITMDLAWKDAENWMLQKGDNNVIFVHGLEAGHAYLLWGEFGKWTQEQFGDKWVKALAWCYEARGRRPRVATMDEELGGVKGAAKKYLEQRAWDAGLEAPRILTLNRRSTGLSKQQRLFDVSPYITDGRYHMVRGVKGSHELAKQILGTGMSGDDLYEAMSDVFHEDVFRSSRLGSSRVPRRRHANRLNRPVAFGDFGPGGVWVPSRPGSAASARKLHAIKRLQALNEGSG